MYNIMDMYSTCKVYTKMHHIIEIQLSSHRFFFRQDAMIHLLLNPGSLSFDAGDSLDPHAVIVPQRELNAYDAPRNVGNVPFFGPQIFGYVE